MYADILFPTDGSDPAASVLEYVVDVAAAHDATIHLLHVVDTEVDGAAEEGAVTDALERAGREILDDAAGRVEANDVHAVTELRRGDPHRAIVDYSEASAADCIVMPTHGRRELDRYLLGSVTERVINTASVPVVAVNPGQERLAYPPRRVLVPTDGSRGAELALARGIDVARATGATLHLLHVVETGSGGASTGTQLTVDDLDGRAADVVTTATQQAEAASLDVVTGVFEHREPATVIRDYVAEHEIDLAVLGTHGRTEFSRYVMGGVSAKLVRTADIPVMWVRETASGSEPEA